MLLALRRSQNYAPHLQAFYPDKDSFKFLQDGAPSHTSDVSIKVLHKIFGAKNWIQNSPNSPDLNVLDYHTWDHWDQIVQKKENIKTPSDLKREIVIAHQNIYMDEVRKAIDSWPKRLQKFLEAKGDRFEHGLYL